jgi:hypothetical protein
MKYAECSLISDYLISEVDVWWENDEECSFVDPLHERDHLKKSKFYYVLRVVFKNVSYKILHSNMKVINL